MYTKAVAASLIAGLSCATGSNAYAVPFQNKNATFDLFQAAAEPLAAAAVLPRASVDGVEPQKRGSISVPLQRHYGDLHPVITKRDPSKLREFALRQGEILLSKYGGHSASAANRKRQTIGLTGVGQDSYYYAQLSIGNPKQNFNIILDTGSSDFWIVDSVCGTQNNCAADLNRYNPGASSTHTGSNTPFTVTYGSGAVRGTLAADDVSLAGYTVHNLTFAQADAIAQGTIDAPASGIMGMGFQTLASSGATPFWEVLAKQGVLESNVFTFQLARNVDNVDISDPNINTVLNPGGVFTLGELDSNQYTGDITYIDIPNNLERVQGLGYWSIPLDSISVNGQRANIGNSPLAAIDTGTTLVGGPQAAVRAVYSLIPGAQTAPGMSGYYLFPCDSDLDIELSFGGKNFRMAVQDMNLGPYPYTVSSTCLGAFFDIDLGSDVYGVPEWIVGDSFLKNVFSIFDSTGRVGFASLRGSEAQTAPITTGAVPSGTATASAASASSSSSMTAGGDGGPPIPSLASGSPTAQATASGVNGGSNLPEPSAQGGVITSTLRPSSGSESAAASFAPKVATSLAAGAAVLAAVALF